VRQLLHVYPLDAKTKEGAPFWSLPKRPPTPVVFDCTNLLHLSFLAAMACLRATIFKVKIPSEKPRSEEFKRMLGEMAKAVAVPEFKVDEHAAKEIQDSVDKEKANEEKKEETKVEEANDTAAGDEVEKIRERLKKVLE
jgi:hypothetical protein